MSWSQWDKIIAQYTLHTSVHRDNKPCPWMFRPRIRLMSHHWPQFRAKADLPVGFPYRFNSSFFFIIFILFLSHYLRSAISLPFFIGSLSYLASWYIITCRTAVYILGYEGQRSRSQGDTRWKCLFSNFSVMYHPIVFKFSWLIVLDKETTWCKIQGRRLKVKVTKRQPWKNVVRLFLSYFWTDFCEIWLV